MYQNTKRHHTILLIFVFTCVLMTFLTLLNIYYYNPGTLSLSKNGTSIAEGYFEYGKLMIPHYIQNTSVYDQACNVNLQLYGEWCESHLKATRAGNISQFCPCVSPYLVGETKINTNDQQLSINEVHDIGLWLEPGGEWFPKECTPIQRIAIIIPYRDRLSHLQILLAHLHPILRRQLHHYRIFVVEQDKPTVFNKAAMMNIAYLEAKNMFDFDCVIFHDVDILLKDDRGIYHCRPQPHHIGGYLSKWNFSLPYTSLVGGILAFRKSDYEKLNGFSNIYFGWGGEDDDMALRIKKQNWKVYRFPKPNMNAVMLHHTKERFNPFNTDFHRAPAGKPSYVIDGLNSVKYQNTKVTINQLYTHISTTLDIKTMKGVQRHTYKSHKGKCNGNNIVRFYEESIHSCQIMCDFFHNCKSIVFLKNSCWLKDKKCSLKSNDKHVGQIFIKY